MRGDNDWRERLEGTIGAIVFRPQVCAPGSLNQLEFSDNHSSAIASPLLRHNFACCEQFHAPLIRTDTAARAAAAKTEAARTEAARAAGGGRLVREGRAQQRRLG